MIDEVLARLIPTTTDLFEPVLPIFPINVLTEFTRRCFCGKSSKIIFVPPHIFIMKQFNRMSLDVQLSIILLLRPEGCR